MTSGQKIRDYVLHSRLGTGGMGEVWKAFHALTRRHVVLKALRDDLGAEREFVERFNREMALQASFDHEGIVRVLDGFVEAGRAYIVMQYVDGATLEDIRVSGRRPALIQCLAWLRQLAEALTYLHARHVVHRDVKPSNILIDSASRARLFDFGIALDREEPGRLTQHGRVPLTQRYASPEQISGGQIDGRSDLYSLALTLYHAWRLGLPQRKADGGHDCPLPQGTAQDVGRIFGKCLATSPADRYASAEDLVADLERLSFEGARAPVESLKASRVWHGLGRRHAAFLLALPLVLALIFLIGRAYWLRDGMVRIPAGEFISGMDVDDIPADIREGFGKLIGRGGAANKWVGEFRIDKYEITNAEYAAFVRDTGWRPPKYWNSTTPRPEIRDHPVVNVSWTDAQAYARWAGKRLPTADEWEKSARGSNGIRYPWGNEFEPERTNAAEAGLGGTTPVAAFPQDVSPFGVIGLGGNVTEWTASPFVDTDGKAHGYVVSGGSWLESGTIVSLAALRRQGIIDREYPDVGFRLAR